MAVPALARARHPGEGPADRSTRSREKLAHLKDMDAKKLGRFDDRGGKHNVNIRRITSAEPTALEKSTSHRHSPSCSVGAGTLPIGGKP